VGSGRAGRAGAIDRGFKPNIPQTADREQKYRRCKGVGGTAPAAMPKNGAASAMMTVVGVIATFSAPLTGTAVQRFFMRYGHQRRSHAHPCPPSLSQRSRGVAARLSAASILQLLL
jgi:hypothetical protein